MTRPSYRARNANRYRLLEAGDAAEAARLLEMAAAAGEDSSRKTLARLLLDGHGLKQDKQRAVRPSRARQTIHKVLWRERHTRARAHNTLSRVRARADTRTSLSAALSGAVFFSYSRRAPAIVVWGRVAFGPFSLNKVVKVVSLSRRERRRALVGAAPRPRAHRRALGLRRL